MLSTIDINKFHRVDYIENRCAFFFVVKSQDQVERRKRMVESKKNGKFGRLKERDTAVGLLVKGMFERGKVGILWQKEFREPRHICELSKGTFLLTEINKINEIDSKGRILREYWHPWFAFLHTIVVDEDKSQMLTVSSGYDMVMELNIQTGIETWRWSAWDNGFNPDDDGYYLASSKEKYLQYKTAGLRAILITPEDYDEHGLITSRRSAHPNMAVYDVYNEGHILISIGHTGDIYRVGIANNRKVKVIDFLGQMPHGLGAYNGGWIVTDTTQARIYDLGKNFEIRNIWHLGNLPGKDDTVGDNEWVQNTLPLGVNQFLAIDSNRGLIHFDSAKLEYAVYEVNGNWCIQDIFILRE